MAELLKIFHTTPITKPRMTRSDKWKQRPIVMAYRAYKDSLRAERDGFVLPDNSFHIIFHIPMPESWAKCKKEALRGYKHQQTPDVDNLAKGIFDALEKEDKHIWDCRITKIWADVGKIEIYKI